MRAQGNSLSCVDIGKCIAALLVVMEHCCALSGWSAANRLFYVLITGTLVPFFFICSGYFLGQHLNRATTLEAYRHETFRYLRKLLPVCIFWGSVHFWIVVVRNGLEGGSIAVAFRHQLIRALLGDLGGPMWYLGSLIYAVLLLAASNRRSYHRMLTGLFLASLFLTQLLMESGIAGDVELNYLFFSYSVYFFLGVILS